MPVIVLFLFLLRDLNPKHIKNWHIKIVTHFYCQYTVCVASIRFSTVGQINMCTRTLSESRVGCDSTKPVITVKIKDILNHLQSCAS